MDDIKTTIVEMLKAIIADSPKYDQIKTDLISIRRYAKIEIDPQKGIQVRLITNIPKWEAHFAASHPTTGGWYTIRFKDGGKGMVNIRPDKTFVPVCQITEEFKEKPLDTFNDAVEALYASIQEFGNPDYPVKK